MAIFAVIAQPSANPNVLGTVISSNFPNDHMVITHGHVWLVASGGTAIDLSNKLQISEGQSGSAIVLEIGSYYGRANPSIWTWIKTKWESTGSG